MFNLKNYILSLNHIKNDDGTITILEDVKVSHNELHTLNTDLKIKEVKGNFDCSYNLLTDLIGSPQIVDGNFYAYSNNLESLIGSPKKVGITFSVSNNFIENLIESPIEVGKDFFVYSNRLTNLANSPEIIHGTYDCHDNNLITLSGATINIQSKFKYHDNINLKQREIDAYYDYVLNLNPSLWRKYKSILSIALLEKYNHLDSASNFNMI